MEQRPIPFSHDYGYLRVASAVPLVNVADVAFNEEQILKSVRDAAARHAQLLVLPELALTGYTCADLFGNDLLLDEAERALVSINICSNSAFLGPVEIQPDLIVSYAA